MCDLTNRLCSGLLEEKDSLKGSIDSFPILSDAVCVMLQIQSSFALN